MRNARSTMLLIVLAGVGLGTPLRADALPVLAVDTDPPAPGAQSTRVVPLGSVFSIEIRLSGIEEDAPLHGFELDLDFDASVLEVLGVAPGGFLATPTEIIESDVLPPDVNFAEVTLGDASVAGDGVLVSIDFTALTVGSSPLALSDVVLSEPFGVPIEVGSLEGALVTVVPEPATLVLLGVGLLAATRLRVERTDEKHRR